MCHTDINNNCSLLSNACLGQVFQKEKKKAYRTDKASFRVQNTRGLAVQTHLMQKSIGTTSQSAHIPRT